MCSCMFPYRIPMDIFPIYTQNTNNAEQFICRNISNHQWYLDLIDLSFQPPYIYQVSLNIL